MSEDIDSLTVNYEEDGVLVVKELEIFWTKMPLQAAGIYEDLQLLRSHKKRLQRRSTDEAGVADKPHKRSSTF